MAGFDLDTAPDIAAIEDEGITIHLKDEKGDLMWDGDDVKTRQPVTWTVAGTYSHTYRQEQAELKRLWNKRARAGDDVTQDSDDIRMAARCTKGFSGFRSKGVALPFSFENAREILRSHKAQHILAQVVGAMGNHERFFAKDSAS